MNDAEYAELMRREQNARLMGWTSNAYVCAGCREAGHTPGDSTYLDWPTYVDAEGKAYCDRHAPRGLDVVGLQPHERENR